MERGQLATNTRSAQTAYFVSVHKKLQVSVVRAPLLLSPGAVTLMSMLNASQYSTSESLH